MTENIHTQPRALAPRRLEQTETLQTLNHWRGVLQNYFRRCQYYSYFLQPNLTWTTSADHGFTVNEQTGLKRNPQMLSADLDGFLETISSYLPFDYISDKLKTETTCMRDVWDILYEVYDAELSTTHYLDYASMTREPQETYRNFFNRLVGFVRQHLPRASFTAEGVSSPATGEVLSIALLDSIAIHWLLTIDRRLINIVKTEFASELKTKRLCQMIKPIASNIDELLNRYGQRDTLHSVESSDASHTSQPVALTAQNDNSTVDMLVNRIECLERNYKGQTGYNRQFKRPTTFKNNKSFCVHCSFLNKQLGLTLSTNHDSSQCVKKRLSVNVVELFDDADNVN